MRLSATSLLFVPAVTLAQDTSRIRTRTSANAVCTNTALTGSIATTTFLAALSVHLGTGDECPQSAALDVHYHNDDAAGCCTQSAILTAADGKLACCACGATCTGSVPAMADWTFSAGKLVTAAVATTGTGRGSTPTPTGSTTTRPASTGTESSPTPAATASTGASSSAAAGLGFFAAMVGLTAGAFAVLL